MSLQGHTVINYIDDIVGYGTASNIVMLVFLQFIVDNIIPSAGVNNYFSAIKTDGEIM